MVSTVAVIVASSYLWIVPVALEVAPVIVSPTVKVWAGISEVFKTNNPVVGVKLDTVPPNELEARVTVSSGVYVPVTPVKSTFVNASYVGGVGVSP